MFSPIAIAGFVVVVAGIIVHWLFARPRLNDIFGADRSARYLDLLRIIVLPITLLFVPQKLRPAGVLRKLVFLLALLCFLVLAVTGFVPKLILGKTIFGYWLMVHATAAPVFIACVAVLAVMSAQENRLDKSYWPWLNTVLRRRPENAALPEQHELIRRLCFWVILFLSLPVTLSAVLAMFPLYGTGWQEFLAQTHRYCTLGLALIAIIYLYAAVLAETGRMAPR